MVGTDNFFYVDLSYLCQFGFCDIVCSKRTYKLNSSCVECEIGYYSDNMGSKSCTPCPPGTYNFNKGGSYL